jgi:hypothetical membrane protein
MSSPSAVIRMSTRRILDRLGAVAWIWTGVYFPVQLVVALAWPQPYSIVSNTISDLGATGCGQSTHSPWHDVFVCSPLHPLMNLGFVFVGVMTAAGAILTWRSWAGGQLARIALIGAILSGVGGVLIGFAPSDIMPSLHGAGVLLQLPGVIAPLVMGLGLRKERPALSVFSLTVGGVGIVGTVLFAMQPPAGAIGIWERIALEPFTVWTTVLGLSLVSFRGAGGSEDTQPVSDDM